MAEWVAVGVAVGGVVITLIGFFVRRMIRTNDEAHKALDQKVENVDKKVDNLQEHLASQDAIRSAGSKASSTGRPRRTESGAGRFARSVASRWDGR